jgi:hypothetical protein
MIVSVMAAGLTACGGAKLGGGKEGAAQAAFQASQSAGRGSKTGQSLVEKALASGATSITLTADCAKGGKASLTLSTTANTNAPVGALTYTITYDACNEDGQNEYSGSMTTWMKFDFDVTNTTASGSFTIGMKGKLTIEGEVSDFIDADVTLTMAFSATSAHSGSVQLVTNGSIKTSEGNYTYANETITITAGAELPQA